MPIKAKRVDPARAAQAARGQFADRDKAGMNYFYYEGVKKRQMREQDADHTSSSSNESSRAGSPKPSSGGAEVKRTAAPSSSSAVAKTAAAPSDVDSDEELLAAARERTRRFLYLDADRSYVPVPYHNDRAAAYARYQEARQRRESAPATITTASVEAPVLASREDNVQADKTPSAAPRHSPVPGVGRAASLPGREVGGLRENDTPHDHPEHTAESTQPPAYDPSTTSDPRRADFYKLLNLIGQDVQREWSDRATVGAAPTSHSPRHLPPSPAARVEATTAAVRTYRPPATRFSDLQDDALQQLYEEWNAGHDGDDNAPVFVAAEHTAEAFTRAAVLASSQTTTVDSFSSTVAAQTRLQGVPPSLEELAMTDAMLHSGRLAATSASAIAAQAQGQLDRFLASVSWIERLVRDHRFIASVGSFLHAHHKVFMRYLATPAEPHTSTLAEHDHQEYAAYQEFGSQFSDLLLRLLTQKVNDFDEAEFVEALYETPVTARTQFAAVNNTAHRRSDADSMGPQNVLSYPAWRIILAMSSFECFFDWMMDYVREEYNLSLLDEEEKVVAVGGARGVRALLRSTYGDGSAGTASPPPATQAAVPPTADSPPRERSDAVPPPSLREPPAPRSPLVPPPTAAPVRLSPSPPPVSLQPLPRPDSSPPVVTAVGATPMSGSVPSAAALPSKFFPTPPASADGRARQPNQKSRLGQRLPPLTAKTLSTDPTANASVPAEAGAAPVRKKSSATEQTRSKSGAKRTASQARRKVSSAGSAKPTGGSRRSSGAGTSAGSRATTPKKATTTTAASVATSRSRATAAAQRQAKPHSAPRAPSSTKPPGGTKPKLKRATPPEP